MAGNNILIENLGGGRIRRRRTNRSAVLHIEIYSNAERPVASDFAQGESIWNTDDNAPNYSDGAGNWRDAAGSIT